MGAFLKGILACRPRLKQMDVGTSYVTAVRFQENIHLIRSYGDEGKPHEDWHSASYLGGFVLAHFFFLRERTRIPPMMLTLLKRKKTAWST